MVAMVMLLGVLAADIGPSAPTGVYVMSRDNVQCRGVGDKRDPVALVIVDRKRVRRPQAQATVAALSFRDSGETRPGDLIETVELGAGRTFHPSTQMVAVITSPGCVSEQVVIGPDVRACLMVVLNCDGPADAGTP